MIIFRYHVVSLIAVLLALAAGIALGAGLDFDNDASKAATPGQSPSEETSNSARSGLDEALVESVEPALVRNRLRDRAVALVVLPDATTEAEKAITASIERAGGRLTSVLRAGPDLVDPAKKQLVDALGGQLEADAKDVVIPESASAYDRIGALLGYAIGTTEAGGDAPSSRAQSILAGLSTAGLISFSQDVERRAGLVLVLAGPPSGDSAADQGIASIVDSLAGALDEQTGGVVVAGPLDAADTGGVLAAIRADAHTSAGVSTVDGVDGPAGAVVAVRALAEQAAGKAGQYGLGAGTTAVLPD